jgi:hypothetical protein
MFIGTDTFAYALLASLFVMCGTYLSLADISQVPTVLKMLAAKPSDPLKLDMTVTALPQFFQLALYCVCNGIFLAYYYGVGSTAGVTVNYKYVWMSSTFWLFSAAWLFDMIAAAIHNNSRWGNTIYRKLSTEEFGTYSRIYDRFNYVFAVLVLVAQLVMSMLCLYMFTTAQATSVVQTMLVVTAAILIFQIILEATRVFLNAGKYATTASTNYQALVNNGAFRIKNVKINLDLLNKQEGKTVKFGPTGAQAFPANNEHVALLHHIEDRIASEGHKYSLGIKDYAVIQNGRENDFIVLKREDAAALLASDKTSSLQRIKYGLLGGKKGSDEMGGSGNPALESYLATDTVPLLSQISSEEPCYLRFTNHVCGYGIGNGAWYNFSASLPYVYTLYMLAYNIYSFRDGGSGLLFTILTSCLAFFISRVTFDGNWFQLLIYNQVLGLTAIVYPAEVRSSNKFLMQTDIIDSLSNNSLQLTSTAMGDTYDAQLTTWFSFATSVAFLIMTVVILGRKTVV